MKTSTAPGAWERTCSAPWTSILRSTSLPPATSASTHQRGVP